jgi:hypothetical protein
MTIKGKNNFLFVRIKNAQPAFMNGIMMDHNEESAWFKGRSGGNP